MADDNDAMTGEVLPGTDLITSLDMNAVEAISRAEIDQQVSTAKKYPRSVQRFVQQSRAMIDSDISIADECLYGLQRRDADGKIKIIEGPSIRFAELIYSAWGNSRAATRIVGIGEEFITAQGMFIDLERNVAVSAEIQRRIVGKPFNGKPGRRFGVDMIGVTGNAAASIALRNAIIRGIPKAVWNPVLLHARALVAGNFQNFGERKDQAIAYLAKRGIDQDRIIAALNIQSLNEMTPEHIVILKMKLTAVAEDPEQTLDQQFPGPRSMMGDIGRVDLGAVMQNGTKATEEKEEKEGAKRGPGRPRGPAKPKAGAETQAKPETASGKAPEPPAEAKPASAEGGFTRSPDEPAILNGGGAAVAPAASGVLPWSEAEQSLLAELKASLDGSDTPEEIAVHKEDFAGAMGANRPAVVDRMKAMIDERLAQLSGNAARLL